MSSGHTAQNTGVDQIERSPETPINNELCGAVSSPQRKWKPLKKWLHVAIVAYCECLTFLVSMMLAPSIPQVFDELDEDNRHTYLGSFTVTIYILGFCVGPLILAPISDIRGRSVMYRTYIVCFLLLTVGCALAPSAGFLIAFRFLAGCFGGAPMALGGAVIADMYEPGTRDDPMAWYSVGNLMGPTLGPILGGVITGLLGWRWVFWWGAILSGIAVLAIFFILRETHPNMIKRASFVSSEAEQEVSINSSFATEIGCILFLICVFNGLVNMILSSLGAFYQSQFHISVTVSGLTYLGIGLGGFAGLSTTKKLKAHLAILCGSRSQGPQPQDILRVTVASLPITAIGLVWYGWAMQRTLHWIVPIFGLFFFGFGYIATRLSTQIFLIDFTSHQTGSALAAHTVASSVGGAIIPLSTFPIFEAVGLGMGTTVMALIALSLCVIPIFLIASLRVNSTNRP